MQELRQLLEEGQARPALNILLNKLRDSPGQEADLARDAAVDLAAAYDRLHVAPVHEFLKAARESVPQEVVSVVIGGVKPLIERTQFWVKELHEVTRERLGREARSAVTLGDLKGAAQRAASLLNRATTQEETDASMRFLIDALGSLVRDAERSLKVVQALVQSVVRGELGFDWRRAFNDALERAKRAGFEESDREWTKVQTGAAAAIREVLPGKMEAGEPTPEQVKRFVGEILALGRAPLVSGHESDLLDVLGLIREFCPTDEPAIQSVTGVERRIFLDLGPKARLAAVRGLGEVGQVQALRHRMLPLANTAEGLARTDLFAPVMGGLRHDDFSPYLEVAFRQAKVPRQQEIVAEAMSRIGNPNAVEMILAEFSKSVRKFTDAGAARKAKFMEGVGIQIVGIKSKAMDPAEGRRAKLLLTALARIARLRLDAAQRLELVEQMIQIVGEKDTELSYLTASQMFASKVEELSRTQRVWAVRQIVRAMFSVDTGQNLAAASKATLGFRQPMIAALTRLGREMLPEMLLYAQPHATKFSGAFPVFAEALQKVGDDRAVLLLETMIRTTFLQSDEPGPSYLLKEKVYDPATQTQKDLDRDEVVHTLLYTLEKIGGEPGKGIVLRIADQIQAGQLESPGNATASFLIELKRKHGTLGRRETVELESVPDEEVQKAASHARGGMFSNRHKQIEALVVLGRARRAETLPVILACLQSKDAMVFRAAETTLDSFVTPLPSPKEYEAIVDGLFSEPKLLKGESLERLIQLIARSFPKRAPYDAIYERQAAKAVRDELTLHRLRGAIQIAGENKPGNGGSASEGAAGDMEGRIAAPTARLTELDRKRQYMLARQEWIRGGKKGPAPEMPDA